MSFNNLQYSLETASIHFRGGVRRSVFIFLGICLALFVPFYFIGQSVGSFWASTDLNPAKINYRNMQNPKTTTIYNYQINRSQRVPLIGETVLYTTINNQENRNIGYSPLTYTVQVLDIDGEIIFSERQQGYLLPGEVKYVIANPGSKDGYEIRLIEESQTNPVLFNPFANNFSNIINSIDIRNPIVLEVDEDTLELRAILKNNSLIEVRELQVLYIVRGNRDRVIGIGQRTINNLQPGEERGFVTRYPQARYRRARNLDIRVRINYMNPGNFIFR